MRITILACLLLNRSTMKKLESNTMKNNNKGFTLIELIIVTVILGVLSAIAVPRFMGAVTNTEAASELATVAALQVAVKTYATQNFLETGRYSYPDNPFDYIEVDGYDGVGTANEDGEWAISGTSGQVSVTHQRRDDNVYSWSYDSSDLTDLDGDDRGANVGLAPENPNSTYVVTNAERTGSTSDTGSGTGF